MALRGSGDEERIWTFIHLLLIALPLPSSYLISSPKLSVLQSYLFLNGINVVLLKCRVSESSFSLPPFLRSRAGGIASISRIALVFLFCMPLVEVLPTKRLQHPDFVFPKSLLIRLAFLSDLLQLLLNCRSFTLLFHSQYTWWPTSTSTSVSGASPSFVVLILATKPI